MSKVYIISDLHLGHANILKFCPHRLGRSIDINIQVHDKVLAARWQEIVNMKDTVYVLGDVAWHYKALAQMKSWPGHKILVRGNHDQLKESAYREVFDKIHGMVKYKQHWLTHAPLHPQSLRGFPNIHGHLHESVVTRWGLRDKRYINVGVEHNHGYPQLLEDLIS